LKKDPLRQAGILLHITSLPSPFGIGDLGPGAYRFADFLSRARQRYWQILPLNPADQGSGNSPYSSISAFAGNTLLISPELLVESGFLTPDDLARAPGFPADRCDYATVIPYKTALLHRAYECFKVTGRERDTYDAFCEQQKEWLEEFSHYVVLKTRYEGKPWGGWDKGLKDRDPKSLEWSLNGLHDEREREKFLQYLFFRQWHTLRVYCNERGIKLIGDIPIYVNYDSVDVWTHGDLFKLNGEKKPAFVAGVPPDYFSSTGQLWGNPVYRWDVLKKTGFTWWIQRIAHNLELFDEVRIDHFRGFAGFWEVPSEEKTAMKGRWAEAPAAAFFRTLLKKIPSVPIIAEDLGVITPDVREVMERFGFPGMRILQFAFDADSATHPYLPHNYTHNCIVYTGTHDNNTTRGWFEHDAGHEERQRLFRYLGKEVSAEEVHREFIRLAMMSVAQTAIIPMQDLLGLGQDARMNRPSTTDHNWEWRLLPELLTSSHADFLLELTQIYGRAL
jgi:4-alpha-glucanotransferase